MSLMSKRSSISLEMEDRPAEQECCDRDNRKELTESLRCAWGGKVLKLTDSLLGCATVEWMDTRLGWADGQLALSE